MKFSSILMAAAMSCLLVSTNLFAEGSGIRGGGDDDGIGFRTTLTAAFNEFNSLPHSLFPELDYQELEKILTTPNYLHVIVVEDSLDVEQDGLEQDSAAVNYPDTVLIEVRRQRWKAMKELRVRQAVSLHELFGLARKEKTGEYTYSSRFLEKFGYAQCQKNLCVQHKSSDSSETTFEALFRERGWKTISPVQYRGREFFAGHMDVLALTTTSSVGDINDRYAHTAYRDKLVTEQVQNGDNICQFAADMSYAASTIVIRDNSGTYAGFTATIPKSYLFVESNPLPGRNDLVLVTKQVDPVFYCGLMSNHGCFSYSTAPVAVFESLTCKK